MAERRFPVVVSNSFDMETLVYLYSTEEKAEAALKELYEKELKVQVEENERVLGEDLKLEVDDSGTWARITTIVDEYDGEPVEDYTEYSIGTIKN